jgi:hypothetical protein
LFWSIGEKKYRFEYLLETKVERSICPLDRSLMRKYKLTVMILDTLRKGRRSGGWYATLGGGCGMARFTFGGEGVHLHHALRVSAVDPLADPANCPALMMGLYSLQKA